MIKVVKQNKNSEKTKISSYNYKNVIIIIIIVKIMSS